MGFCCRRSVVILRHDLLPAAVQTMPMTPRTASVPWWAASWFIGLSLVLIAVPMAWPDLLPLSDLPGHLGRYRIMLDVAHSEHLQRFYEFRWQLVPNLGVDLAMIPAAALLGVEPALKAIVVLTAILTLVGFIWASYEAHGRHSPTWLFAAPLILGYSFQYGFLNFSLAIAFAFLGLGLWMALARRNCLTLRSLVFIPISAAIWITHGIGWGVFGLLAYAAEWARLRDRGHAFLRSALLAAWHCLPLAAPLILAFIWHSGAASVTTDWFNVEWKLVSIAAALRDRWLSIDVMSVSVILAVIVLGVADRRLEWSRPLAAASLLLLAAFIVLPQILLGTARNDIRLVPLVLATALLAVRPTTGATRAYANRLALAGLAFFTLRIAANTTSLWLLDREYSAELRALDHLPHGARLVSFVGVDCTSGWGESRLEHLSAMAIVRREAFSNDQWSVAGSHLLKVREPWAEFVDPSQFVTAIPCHRHWRPISDALATLPTGNFDYLWLIRPHPFEPGLAAGWEEVWRHGSSVLYRLHQQ